jgi:hypothetical protein
MSGRINKIKEEARTKKKRKLDSPDDYAKC